MKRAHKQQPYENSKKRLYTDTVIHLTTLYDNPVKDTNKINLFIAENVTKAGQQELDVTEEIDVVLNSCGSSHGKIATENLCFGTVAAIFFGKFLK